MISYDLHVSFDPSVVAPASPSFEPAGTMSNAMKITANTGFPGHLIISAFQAQALSGSGTLLYLNFNVIGTVGQSTNLAFTNYTDPGQTFHPAFVFNEGNPLAVPINGPRNDNRPYADSIGHMDCYKYSDGITQPDSYKYGDKYRNTHKHCNSHKHWFACSDSSSVFAICFWVPGIVSIPITVGNLTGLGVISYDLNIDFDPTIAVPASPAFTQAGTLSSAMSITPNATNPGHLIISAFQGASLTGSGTLLVLHFNVTGLPGSTPLAFMDYTDPGMNFHPGFMFNEGSPLAVTTNGGIIIPAGVTSTSTSTSTATITPTAVTTATITPSPGSTPSPVPVSLPNLSVGTGEPVTVPITVETDISDRRIFSYEFQITYDPAILIPASPVFDQAGTISSEMLITSNTNNPGHLIIEAFATNLKLTGSGTLLNLRFNTVGLGQLRWRFRITPIPARYFIRDSGSMKAFRPQSLITEACLFMATRRRRPQHRPAHANADKLSDSYSDFDRHADPDQHGDGYSHFDVHADGNGTATATPSPSVLGGGLLEFGTDHNKR